MLHPAIVREMLKEEIRVARERHGARVASLVLSGTNVLVSLVAYTICLDGAAYDGEPFKIFVVDSEMRPEPGPKWPPGLCHGEQPVLRRPFVCIQGTYEYHVHPSHLADAWDRYRGKIRLAELLDHLLRKCNR